MGSRIYDIEPDGSVKMEQIHGYAMISLLQDGRVCAIAKDVIVQDRYKVRYFAKQWHSSFLGNKKLQIKITFL